jgi:histidinol dehydrogenase
MDGPGRVTASEVLVPDSFTMRVLRWHDLDDDARDALLSRGAAGLSDQALRSDIAKLVEDVRQRGDPALVEALERFDECVLTADELRVAPHEFTEAHAQLSPRLHEAIRIAIGNSTRFNEEILRRQDWTTEIADGITVGQRSTPVASAGLFVPGGKASYPSVLIHLGVPARVAGVPSICVAVPPRPGEGGRVDPAVLVVAEELGIRDVFRVNGPTGIAALAFGTATVPQVAKIAGPGSPAVVCAQREVLSRGIDVVVLGPSDSVVVADRSADPTHVAADLLNEAEHGADSSSLLVTWDDDYLELVQHELQLQFGALPAEHQARVTAALRRNGGAVLVRDAAEAAEVVNSYAPEHVLVNTRVNPQLISAIVNAGELLSGANTPISMANFTIGVPNSLPTGGMACSRGGVTAETFRKPTAIAELSRGGFESLAMPTITLAKHEGFPAHAASVQVRLAGEAT